MRKLLYRITTVSLRIAISSMLLFFVTANAHAVLIDFNTATPITMTGGNNEIRTVTFTADGVDVTFSGFNLFVTGPILGVSQTIATQGFGVYPVEVFFEKNITADYVEINNVVSGTYTSEVDVIVGTAFDALGSIVDTNTTGEFIHKLNGPGISSLLYTDSGNTGFTLANFSFEYSRVSIPEPSTVMLMSFGLAIFGFQRRSPT